MAILYVGIDLAKNVLAVHGVNESGKAELVRLRALRGKRASCRSVMAHAVARTAHARASSDMDPSA